MQARTGTGALPAARVTGKLPAGDAATTRPANDRLGILLALVTLYIVWGSTYYGIRVALEGYPPFMMGALRFLVAGVLLYVFLRLRGAPNPTRAEWKGSIILGVFMLVGGFGGVTFAEQWVTSALAALAVGATPLWAALWSGLFGRWPRKLEWYGLALGFAGLVVLNLGGTMQASALGAILLIIAPASWAFAAVCSQRLTLPAGFMSSAAEMLAGGTLLLLLALAHGERLHQVPALRPTLALLYLIIFGSLLAFSAFLYLLSRVRPAIATSYGYVNPVVAVGVGVWLGGEQVSVGTLVAMPVILAGVVLVLMGRGPS